MSIRNVFAPALGVSLLFLVTSAAHAQSACKGLSSSRCSATTDCVWVSGYTRKDNKKVSGYCRSKGGKGSSTARDRGSATVRDKGSASKRSSSEKKGKKSESKKKEKTKR